MSNGCGQPGMALAELKLLATQATQESENAHVSELT